MSCYSLPCLLLLSLTLLLHPEESLSYEVVYAVNCGGPRHVDKMGIKYKKDDSDVGVASDYGKTLSIARVPPEDMILYQTERYNNRDFSYDVQIPSNGDYVLVLKFAEVYFQAANQKVFNVILNAQHFVSHDLDIFDRVGRGVAYDEVVPFSVRDGTLSVLGETSEFDGTLVIEFAKGQSDNPKINAILVIKGDQSELPTLVPMEMLRQEQESQSKGGDTEWGEEGRGEEELKFKRTSGPRVNDPYSSDESWFWPITIAVAIFLPVLFCLCRVR